MNEIRKADRLETSAFDQAALEMTGQVWGRTEAVTRAMLNWNSEAVRFISDRISRNVETLGRMTQCSRPPEMFEIEADWLRTALEDYAKGVNKLMEASSLLLSWAAEDHGSTATDDRHHGGSAAPRIAAKAAA